MNSEAHNGRGPARLYRLWHTITLAAALLLIAAAPLVPYTIAPYTIIGDAIPRSLTGTPGDPARGHALILAREVSTCLLCHGGPFANEHFQGDIGPSLAGVGSRLSEGQIRLRIVNPSLTNPDTVMPAFYRTDGLRRVGTAWQGRPVLDAAQIEDVVAYLATLRAPTLRAP